MREFKRFGDYSNHVKTCGTSKLCTYCGAQFATSSSARRHEKTCTCKEISKDVLQLRVKALENEMAQFRRYAQRWQTARDRLYECRKTNRVLEEKVGVLEYRLEQLEKRPAGKIVREEPETEKEERKLDLEIDPVWIYRGIAKNPREPWKKIIMEVMDAHNADVQGSAVVCGYNDKYDIWRFTSEILINSTAYPVTFVDSAFGPDGERLYEPNTYAMTDHKKPWRKFVRCVLNDLDAMKSHVIDYMDTFR